MADDSHAPLGTTSDEMRTIDERASYCFGCGPHNAYGLKLSFVIDDSNSAAITASTTVHLARLYEGPPGYIHGGIIATLLDEAMSKLNRPLAVLAMTRSLAVEYLRPSPLETPLRLVSRHLRRDGRKVFHCADLMREDGTVLAHGEGFFLVIDPALMARAIVERSPFRGSGTATTPGSPGYETAKLEPPAGCAAEEPNAPTQGRK